MTSEPPIIGAWFKVVPFIEIDVTCTKPMGPARVGLELTKRLIGSVVKLASTRSGDKSGFCLYPLIS
jgi:hypothetical protein